MLLKLGPALLMRHGAKAETWTEIEIIRKCYSQKFSNKSLRGKKNELNDKALRKEGRGRGRSNSVWDMAEGRKGT